MPITIPPSYGAHSNALRFGRKSKAEREAAKELAQRQGAAELLRAFACLAEYDQLKTGNPVGAGTGVAEFLRKAADDGEKGPDTGTAAPESTDGK